MNENLSHPEIKHQTLISVVEYEAAIDGLIQKAIRHLRIFDNTLNNGYGAIRRYDLLRSFLSASKYNRLLIALHDSETLSRNCPRLLNLARQFSYSIEIRETQPEAKTAHDPVLIADESHYLRRFHFDYPRSLLAFNDPSGARVLLQRFDEIWVFSEPVAAPTTLGL